MRGSPEFVDQPPPPPPSDERRGNLVPIQTIPYRLETKNIAAAAATPDRIRPFSAMQCRSLVLPVMMMMIFSIGNGSGREANQPSELNFDYQDLSSISNELICTSSLTNETHLRSQVNSLTFVGNRINRLETNGFVCVASELRILALSSNRIDHISRGAFEQLSSLQVLLLDNNLLTSVPSRDILGPLGSLRHLNLADNRIERLPAGAFGSQLAGLISLNLAGNPLHQLDSGSLRELTKLKTLTLSRTWYLFEQPPLEGLRELRFLHLDRRRSKSEEAAAAALAAPAKRQQQQQQQPPENLCQSSPKLSSLLLKSNSLELIPSFAHCQNLLLLDLSYNNIRGSLSENFTHYPNLIDLYLGHNSLDSIEERAFVGLGRLQVLELNNNRLIRIEARAFLPVQATLSDLNLSNNPNLVHLNSLGLNGINSLKAYGNLGLRELPHFESATSLALTYAYHCCDYQAAAAAATINDNDDDDNTPPTSENYYRRPESSSSSSSSLFVRLLAAAKSQDDYEDNASDEQQQQQQQQHPAARKLIAANRSVGISAAAAAAEDDLNELILWPSSPPPSQPLKKSAAAAPPSQRRTKRRRRRRHASGGGPRSLIDELVEELKRIREQHSISSSSSSGGGGGGDEEFKSTALGKVAPTNDSSPNASGTALLQLVAERLLNSSRGLRQLGPAATTRPARAAGWSGERRQRQQQRVRCLPAPSAFLPCKDLFDTWWLRAGIWAVFLLALAGNTLVIIVLSSVRQTSTSSALTSIMWLAHSKRHIDVPRFLVINLAIADLLMALYLGVLAFVDASTLGAFRLHAIKWQYSTGCRLAGFLAVLSSELSVFILAIITLERNYAITNAVHLNRRLSLQKAMFIMFLGYAFALAMAILPLYGVSDYRKFSICLPLDVESSLHAQIYVITLISINAFSFILLLGCYLRMYCAIRGSQAWNANDLRIAKRMSILVLTDFLCWSPIIASGLASLFGYHLIGTQGMKTLTIFVLPLNSVANPFLYAITTKKFHRDLSTLARRLRALARLECLRPPGGAHEPHQQHNQLHAGHHILLAGKHPKVLPLINLRSNCRQQQQRDLMLFGKKQGKAARMRLANGAGGGGGCGDARLRAHTAAAGQQHMPTAATATPASRRRTPARNAPTPNQVTMNRTTCSCQQQQAYRDSSGKTIQAAHEQRQRLLLPPPLRPRIVLEQVAAFEQHHRQPFGQRLKKSRSTGTGLVLVMMRADQDGDHSGDLLRPWAGPSAEMTTQLRGREPSSCSSGGSSSSTTTSAASGAPHGNKQRPRAAGKPYGRDSRTSGLINERDDYDDHDDGRARPAAPPPPPLTSQERLGEFDSAAAAPAAAGSGCLSKVAESIDTTSGSSQAANKHWQQQRQQQQQQCASTTDVGLADWAGGSLSATNSLLVQCAAADQAVRGAARWQQPQQQGAHLSVDPFVAALPDIRSASACGQFASCRKQTSDGLAAAAARNEYAAANPATRVSGSYDTVRVASGIGSSGGGGGGVGGPSMKLSRSIQRLLFGPIAKAWSSIQISLSSSVATHIGQEPQQRQQHSHTTDYECCSLVGLGGQQPPADADDGRLPPPLPADGACLVNEHFDLDDILLMSSPAKKSLKIGERRMSRSCDAISQANNCHHHHHHHHQNNNNSGGSHNNNNSNNNGTNGNNHNAILNSPSSSGQEQSSSQCDYDDDQRILLATINRLATGGHKTRLMANSGMRTRGGGGGGGGAGTAAGGGGGAGTAAGGGGASNLGPNLMRGRCTRCRSWSPALLSKLENCIYQMKSRFAAGFTPQGSVAATRLESSDQQARLQESELVDNGPTIVGQANNVDSESGGEEAEQDEDDNVLDVHGQGHCGPEGEDSDDERFEDDEEEDDGDDDHGGRVAPIWGHSRRNTPLTAGGTTTRRRRFSREQSGRLQQQSSINSDTLSTRTAGTLLTNMSFSSDSSASIQLNANNQIRLDIIMDASQDHEQDNDDDDDDE